MVQIFPMRIIQSQAQANSSSYLGNKKANVSGNVSVSKVPTVVISRSISDEIIPRENTHDDSKLSFVIYSQTVGYHTQTGICAALSIEDYINGVLKRHENTIKGFEPCLNIDEPCRKQEVC